MSDQIVPLQQGWIKDEALNADMPEGPNGPHYWYTQFIGIRATNEFKLFPVKRNIDTTDLKTATILQWMA